MPEGPEVTVIREDLNSVLKNKTLTEFNILSISPYYKKSPDNYDYFTSNLPIKIKEIKSKGKLIYWVFTKNLYMSNSLGMSGIWSTKKEKHATIEIVYNGGKLYFIDQRRFGKIKFYKNKDSLQEKLDTLGPDILNDNSLTFKNFKERMKAHPKWNITKALMDQSIVSGIGNYLKGEILYDAKISPHRQVSSLSDYDLKNLYTSSKTKIVSSYLNKGMSMKDFVDVNGNKGKFKFFLNVYCMKEDTYGNKVKAEKTKDGRTTYWVPAIQV